VEKRRPIGSAGSLPVKYSQCTCLFNANSAEAPAKINSVMSVVLHIFLTMDDFLINVFMVCTLMNRSHITIQFLSPGALVHSVASGEVGNRKKIYPNDRIIFSNASIWDLNAFSPPFVIIYVVLVFLPINPFCTLIKPFSSRLFK